MPTDGKTCATCFYLVTTQPEDKDGECHRYPPDAATTDIQQRELSSSGHDPFLALFPLVLLTGWCGEWQRK